MCQKIGTFFLFIKQNATELIKMVVIFYLKNPKTLFGVLEWLFYPSKSAGLNPLTNVLIKQKPPLFHKKSRFFEKRLLRNLTHMAIIILIIRGEKSYE